MRGSGDSEEVARQAHEFDRYGGWSRAGRGEAPPAVRGPQSEKGALGSTAEGAHPLEEVPVTICQCLSILGDDR